MLKYVEVYFVGDNQASNRVQVDSFKTRNRGAFSGSLAALAVSSRVLSVRSLLRLPFHKMLLEMLREIRDLISSHEY